MYQQSSMRVVLLSLVAVVSSRASAAALPDTVFHVPEVLVRHAAVPRPVGTGPSNSSRHMNDTEPWTSETGLVVHERYEYYVEHEISTVDAKKAAKMLNLSNVNTGGPGCGVCTRRDMEYCETKMVADHCCCERRYLPEPFPWLPHTCYFGRERCTPLAGNCAFYTRIRDCCCTQKLAIRWKGILSNSGQLGATGVSVLLLGMVLFAVYL